jgi:LPPG:FO 2-phospho-L-lactate transferase
VISVVCGGVGAARFLRGLQAVAGSGEIEAVINTGDDVVIHGLAVSPDIDTITYTLAGAIDPQRGWGLADETWNAMGSLARYGAARPEGSHAGETWFNLGDRDLATHLYRTGRLAEGASLTTVTGEIAAAWNLSVRLLPMTDDRVETRVDVAGEGELSFQQYFVGRHHAVAVTAVRFAGADSASLTAAAHRSLRTAEIVVIAPSNPIVSIGPIRALNGVDQLLSARRRSVVAISPIIAGAALKGPADRMLTELGCESSAVGVARLYAPICSTFVIDELDRHLAPRIEQLGLRCVVTDTVMATPQVAAALALTAVGAGT